MLLRWDNAWEKNEIALKLEEKRELSERIKYAFTGTYMRKVNWYDLQICTRLVCTQLLGLIPI